MLQYIGKYIWSIELTNYAIYLSIWLMIHLIRDQGIYSIEIKNNNLDGKSRNVIRTNYVRF